MIEAGHQLPLPTLPGKTTGIVGWEPCAIQCGECGLVEVDEGGKPGFFILLSGSLFCTVEGKGGIRRCRACVDDHRKSCHRCVRD